MGAFVPLPSKPKGWLYASALISTCGHLEDIQPMPRCQHAAVFSFLTHHLGQLQVSLHASDEVGAQAANGDAAWGLSTMSYAADAVHFSHHTAKLHAANDLVAVFTLR